MRSLIRNLTIGTILFFMRAMVFIGEKNVVLAAEFEDAVNIPINGSVMGSTEEGYYYEKDYYKFTVTNDGYVVLNFKNPMQKNSDTYWRMFLYNSNYEEICNTDISGSKTSTNSTAIGVTAGTYYIKVNSAGYTNVSSTDIYTIQVNYISSGVWEKEFNENFVDSTPMRTNETYYGTTREGYYYEKDYYSFSTTKNGYVKVRFTNPLQETSKEYWKIYVYNSQYEAIYSQTITGNYEVTDLPAIGIPAGKYYLRVESTGYTNVLSTDIYGIRVNYVASELWEKEINDDFTSATPIVVGSQYSGTTTSGYSYEKDFYKFNISPKGLYAIGLTTSNLNDDSSYWNMFLYNSSYKELGKKVVYGNKTFHCISQTLPAGTYYVKVTSANYSSAASMQPYRLKVATTTKAEIQANCEHEYSIKYIDATYFSRGYKLHKCKLCDYSYKSDYSAKKVLNKGYLYSFCSTGKGSLKLQWSTVTNASGYQIRYSKKKSMKKGVVTKTIKGQSKYKKTIKKLSRRKKYYVQIRAYKKLGNKVVYGKWSAKICLKTK